MKKEETQGKAGKQKIWGQVREKMNQTRHGGKDPAEWKSEFEMRAPIPKCVLGVFCKFATYFQNTLS